MTHDTIQEVRSGRGPTERPVLLRQDRIVVIAGLVVVSLVSWAYLFYDARRMRETGSCCTVMGADWRSWFSLDALMLLVMWSVMMVAMMAPTAGPMALTFAAVNRRRRESQRPYVPTAFFLLGYLLAWTLFSAVATAAQFALHSAALLSPGMVSTSPWLGATILIAAGLFQLTPLKHACLNHCRSPLTFIMTEWREGTINATRMGLHHGLHCLGCCWILMMILFVTGVMNLLWVAILTAFVLFEKAAPAGPWVGRVAGVIMIAWGVVVLARH